MFVSSSPTVYSEVRAAHYLDLCVIFGRSFFDFMLFPWPFGACPSSIYGF